MNGRLSACALAGAALLCLAVVTRADEASHTVGRAL